MYKSRFRTGFWLFTVAVMVKVRGRGWKNRMPVFFGLMSFMKCLLYHLTSSICPQVESVHPHTGIWTHSSFFLLQKIWFCQTRFQFYRCLLRLYNPATHFHILFIHAKSWCVCVQCKQSLDGNVMLSYTLTQP